jgi:hypothetical protein
VAVRVKRVISKRIRRTANGIDLVADVNADLAVNVTGRRDASKSRSTRTADRPPQDAGSSERGKETG